MLGIPAARLSIRPWHVLGGVTILAASLAIVSGLFTALAPFGVLAMLVAVSFMYWRLGVYIVFVATVVEGYLRIRGGNPQILLVKDTLLGAIYLRLLFDNLVRRRPLVPPSVLNIPLAAFAGVVIAQTLNPNIVSVGELAIGLRTWLWYIPLFYVGYEMARGSTRRSEFQTVVIVGAVATASIAALQYAAGPAAYSGQGVAFQQATFVTGVAESTAAVFRPNSTFAWPSHFALFLAIGTLFSVALVLKARGWYRVGSFAVLTFLTIMNLVEGQRTMYVLLPVLTVMMLAASGRMRGRLHIVAAIPIAFAVLAVASPFLPPELGVLDRPLALFGVEGGTFNVRASTYIAETVGTAVSEPLGHGPGATAIGSRYLTGETPLFVEFSAAKVAGDLGVVGLIVYGWMFARLLAFSVRLIRSARGAGDAKAAAEAAALLGAVILTLFTGYDIAIVAVTFWFLVGTFAGSAHRDEAPSGSGLSYAAEATSPTAKHG